jgi:PEP-CTERM motif
MQRIATGLAVAVLLLAGAGKTKADLIVNGSFEAPVVAPGYGIFANGSVPGWTSNNNETEIGGTTTNYGLPNYAGIQNLELNGNTYDTISQTVTGLTPGTTYVLTFAYGDRPGSGFNEANILFGGVQIASESSATTAPGTWTPVTLYVTATSTSEVLSFAAVDTSGSGGTNPSLGNEIDAVTLNAVVPEPSTMTIFGLGAFGFMAYGWCRRKLAAPTA